ncbi:MAG: helix-turn-helix domain-containing protein [Enterococcus sp.]
MNHSSLIKKLRKERGLSQSQLAKGISQRSTLASFEKSAQKISSTLLIQYLERMNITLEEYQYLLDKENFSEKREHLFDFYQQLTEDYDEEFEKSLLVKFDETNDSYYWILHAMYYLILKRENKEIIYMKRKEKLRSVIIEHLDSIENWGHFEFFIFIHTLFCFEDTYIYYHFTRSVKRMKAYLDYQYYDKDIAVFLIQGVQLAFDRGAHQLFHLFMIELKKFAKQFHTSDAVITWKLFDFLSTTSKYDYKKKKELLFVLNYLGKKEEMTYVEKYMETE